MTNIPYGSQGFASFNESGEYTTQEVFCGDLPRPFTESYPVAAETTLEQYSVVGLDGSGDLALATEDGTVQAIGVLLYAITTGVGETDNVPIWRAGCFDRNVLVFDTSYDTDAKKQAAFEGAPSPTQVVLKTRL